VAIVLAVSLIVAAVVGFGPRLIAGTTQPPTTAVAPDPLLNAADMAPLGQGTWTPSAENPNPTDLVCFSQQTSPASLLGPRVETRKMTDASSPDQSAIQVVYAYPDATSATQEFTAAQQIAGTCPDGSGQVVSGFQVSGLADAATGSVILAQGPTPLYHTLLVTQTGQTVSITDVSGTNQVSADAVAAVAKTGLTRLCSDGKGTCPSSVAVTASVPAAGPTPGWLLPADLPQITAGAGRWDGNLRTSVTVHGSQCEAISLTQMSGATSVKQWTLLLTGDPNQPPGFGIDQVVYTFPAPKAATTLVNTLKKNIGACPKTMKTASVASGGSLSGVGVGNAALSATTFTVTQTINTQKRVFRVSVVQAGNEVGYLIALVTANFNFTNDEWNALTLRAGQRMTQT